MGSWKSLKIDSGTGWKEIYREAGSGGWKALDWESAAIDIGPACIARPTVGTSNYTYLQLLNPSNGNGSITSVCLYVDTAGTFYVGIFYLVSGSTYRCRSAANLGALSTGENNENVSLSVQTNDVIGWWSESGKLEVSSGVPGGKIYSEGNKCIVDNQSAYSAVVAYEDSCYGTG